MLTMTELTTHIETFGATISRQPLRLAKHCPDVAAQQAYCFENVRRKVEQPGGKTQFGWMFNYRVVEALPGSGYLMAIHHAVWAAPDGTLIDVTPFHENSLHYPLQPGRGEIFFLADDTATLPEFAPLENRFYPLTSDQQLSDHIERLREKEQDDCREIHERNKRAAHLLAEAAARREAQLNIDRNGG